MDSEAMLGSNLPLPFTMGLVLIILLLLALVSFSIKWEQCSTCPIRLLRGLSKLTYKTQAKYLEHCLPPHRYQLSSTI